ncbi:MAG TPA: class I adenylate-forming enzyme family protein, partial [Acidimicrobiales bacterium]|nr:class I adenylate-forming enzyme family protein [Acidimicrobiales bacterium]
MERGQEDAESQRPVHSRDPPLVNDVANITVAGCVAHWAESRPGAPAVNDMTWADYLSRSAALAARLEPGSRVAVRLPDGPDFHVALLAAEMAGALAVGIGWRAGPSEVEHLLARSGATAMISDKGLTDVAGRPLSHSRPQAARGLGPEDVFLLNSTSGTTGLPKLVAHTERRWFYFHELAVAAAALSEDDVFCSAVPGPYGFGLWTQHFTPA